MKKGILNETIAKKFLIPSERTLHSNKVHSHFI